MHHKIQMQQVFNQCVWGLCGVFLCALVLYGAALVVKGAEAAPPGCTGYAGVHGYIGVLPEFDC
jgi:hypothetical protein